MATSVKPIYHLPSFILDEMAPAEYCNSLAFLRDGTSLEFDTWPPPVYRVLLLNSNAAFFDPNIIVINGPRQPCAAIGSERKNLGISSYAKIASTPLILEKDFADNEDTTSINSGRATLATRKVSKFAKWFEPSEPHGETPNVITLHESNHTVTDTTSPNETRSERGFIHPKIEHHGDMSNLRPDDQGMDAATCVKYHRQCTIERHRLVIAANPNDNEAFAALQKLEKLTAIDSDDKDASTSKKVTFDLGAQFATRSTPEQQADTRARGRELANQEAATLKSKQRDERELPPFDPPFAIGLYPRG